MFRWGVNRVSEISPELLKQLVSPEKLDEIKKAVEEKVERLKQLQEEMQRIQQELMPQVNLLRLFGVEVEVPGIAVPAVRPAVARAISTAVVERGKTERVIEWIRSNIPVGSEFTTKQVEVGTGVDRSTVWRALDKLVASGEIVRLAKGYYRRVR